MLIDVRGEMTTPDGMEKIIVFTFGVKKYWTKMKWDGKKYNVMNIKEEEWMDEPEKKPTLKQVSNAIFRYIERSFARPPVELELCFSCGVSLQPDEKTNFEFWQEPCCEECNEDSLSKLGEGVINGL